MNKCRRVSSEVHERGTPSAGTPRQVTFVVGGRELRRGYGNGSSIVSKISYAHVMALIAQRSLRYTKAIIMDVTPSTKESQPSSRANFVTGSGWLYAKCGQCQTLARVISNSNGCSMSSR